MKSAAAPTEPIAFQTKDLSHQTTDQLRPRAEVCSEASDGESVAKYLFKLSRDVILSLDRVGNILCINQRGVQLSGYSESELRGANLLELLLFPEDWQITHELLADLVEGKRRPYEVRGKAKDGLGIHYD